MTDPKMTNSDDDQPVYKRPTMKDVALKANVHQTTVSLALRNHPSIPEKTRQRIRVAAKDVGYRPDPILDAFNTHRLSRHPIRSAPTIAFISDKASKTDMEADPVIGGIWRGAKAQSDSAGYTLAVFLIGPNRLSDKRLNTILETRNIDAAIIASLDPEVTKLDLEWKNLCSIKVESFSIDPRLDVVTPNHRQAARKAVSTLQEQGAKRIGLVRDSQSEPHRQDLLRSGYLVETNNELEEIEDFAFTLANEPIKEQIPAIRSWIESAALDAVISSNNEFLEALRESVHADNSNSPTIASLGLPCAAMRFGGIDLDYDAVGAQAIDMLGIRLYTNQRGIPEHPSVTYAPVTWKNDKPIPQLSLQNA